MCVMLELIAEQHSDASLADCWQQAKANKGDFVISRGVLYHKDKVEGQPICQLCVPEGKRVQILKLAHDSVFGCHLGERKTRERESDCHFTGLGCIRTYRIMFGPVRNVNCDLDK